MVVTGSLEAPQLRMLQNVHPYFPFSNGVLESRGGEIRAKMDRGTHGILWKERRGPFTYTFDSLGVVSWA